MGLISTEVEVGLSGKSISHYENLGYEIPRYFDTHSKKTAVRRGTKIKVKVKDLQRGSNVIVDIQCDNCGIILQVSYHAYNCCNHQGKYYCNSCASQIFLSGENNYQWNPNITDEERQIGRNYPEYKAFIKRVLARDNYTCQCCGEHSNNLCVHHLDSYDWCKEKRTDDTNGITLCNNCHKTFHFYYGKGHNTQIQFEKWMNNTVSLLTDYQGNLPTARQIYDLDEQERYNSAYEYSKIHQCDVVTVYHCCNHDIKKSKYIKKNGEISYYERQTRTVKGHHLLWYDEYLNMSQQDLSEYLQHNVNKHLIKVICITTNQIFNSLSEASVFYKANINGICACCKGKNKTAGKFNGVPLKWMYLSDFENLSQDEQNRLLN